MRGQRFIEPDQFALQIKASETLKRSGSDCVFDIDIRDYNLWSVEDMAVFLVLYEATRRRAYWLYVQGYFGDAPSRKPKKGAKTVRVRVPERQRVNPRGVARMRELKQADAAGAVIP